MDASVLAAIQAAGEYSVPDMLNLATSYQMKRNLPAALAVFEHTVQLPQAPFDLARMLRVWCLQPSYYIFTCIMYF
jgi:hypothetical protein